MEGLWLWFGVQAKEGEGWKLRLEVKAEAGPHGGL